MQSDKAPKKTSKTAKKPAAAPAEKSIAPETTSKPSRVRAKETKSAPKAEMTSGKRHHKSVIPAEQTASPVKSIAEKAVWESAAVASHVEIAALAYSYWLSREQAHGSHEEDWIRAERELAIK